MKPARYAALLLLVLLPAVGCSLAGDEGGSTEDLLADARIARREGRFERAVEWLRQAQQAEPANGEVRLELAAALLDRAGLTVFDVQASFEHITGDGPGAEVGEPGAVCSASDVAGTVTPFDPAGEGRAFGPTYRRLASQAAVVEEVRGLVAGVLPDALYTFALSGFVVPDGAGGYTLADYGAEALLADVRAAIDDAYADPTRAAVDQALLTLAAAQFFSSYLGLFPDPLPAGLTGFYRVAPADGGGAFLRVCAADEAALAGYLGAALGPVTGAGAVVVALDLRRRHHAGGASAELLGKYVDDGVAVFRTVYDGFRAGR